MKHAPAYFEKHVNEQAVVCAVPWATYLAQAGVTISTSEWSNVTSGGGNVTLNNPGTTAAGTITFVMLGGGTDGDREYLENRVVFSDGSDAVYSVTVVLVDKVP